MKKYNICTNFYSNYLYKGLALYYSLEKTSKDFCLWILCMDKETYDILSKLKLKHAKLVKLEGVENKELLKVKPGRNKAEYSWTLKSNFMSYLLKKQPAMPSIFYLDGDIFFFNDIKHVYKDIGEKSLAAAPHRFPKTFESRVEKTGIFNAGVVYIKNDKTGLKTLDRWRKQCIKWCFWRLENGKLGDQIYLDEWPDLYGDNLHQFRHPGINLAPWNVNEYKIAGENQIKINNNPLVFYHFHQLQIYYDMTVEPSPGYYISRKALSKIYAPYEKELIRIINQVNTVNPELKNRLEKKNELKVNINKVKRYIYPLYWKIKSFLK